MQKGPPEWQNRRAFLKRQQAFIEKLVSLMKSIARESGNRKKKVKSHHPALVELK
jgi:phosphatidylinositol 3-kinase